MRMTIVCTSGRQVTGEVVPFQQEDVQVWVEGGGHLPDWLNLVTIKEQTVSVNAHRIEMIWVLAE